VNYRDLSQKLIELDCCADRYAKAGHIVWVNPVSETRTTIPNWGDRDLHDFTVSIILDDLGIPEEEFRKQCADESVEQED
jgi:hypothetical protein